MKTSGTKKRNKVSRKEPELLLQMEIVEMLKTKLKRDVFYTAFPAGGGGRVRGAKLKKAGLQAGWPDIQLIYKGRFYGLEIKTPIGRLSPAQIDLHKKLTGSGCLIAVVRSVSETLEKVIDWGLARKYKKTLESGSSSSNA